MTRILDIFDRETETAAVVRFIESPLERMLVLVGESGCGKSAIVDKAIRHSQRTTGDRRNVLHYRFEDAANANEGERFPRFLMDAYATTRPTWFIDRWMRRHGAVPESWSLRLPFASFTSRAPGLANGPHADGFYAKFSQTIGECYHVIRLENAENFGAQHNLVTIGKLAAQSAGPKLIVEIGTLSSEAEAAAGFFRPGPTLRVLRIGLFGPAESAKCFTFVHQRPAPADLFESSKGNALSIRHHGTPLAELPVGAAVRQRLSNVPPQDLALLWCVAALSGTADLNILERVFADERELDHSLIRLTRSKILRLTNEDHVEFGHSLFTRYFLSPEFRAEVSRFGHRRIIAQIEQTPNLGVADERELARQYAGVCDYQRAWEHAMRAAVRFYRQENFRAVVDIAPLLERCSSEVPNTAVRTQLLLLQTAVRLGDVRAFVHRLSHLEGCEDRIGVLLRAQGYYLMNRFEDAVSECGKLAAVADDTFVSSRALGIRAASLIALGRHAEAGDDFGAAMALAEQTGDPELQLELARLSPEIECEAVWRSRRAHLAKSVLPDRFPYLYAKCLHNFSANELLISGGKEGVDDLESAAAVFEAGKYPEYSYAVAMRTAAYLLEGRIAHARTLLESARPFCHEAYDRFAFDTNLGVASALEECWEQAADSFELAEAALRAGPFPLDDPYFRFQSAHNRALTGALLGRSDLALSLLTAHPVPTNCLDFDAKVARRTHLLDLIRRREPLGRISDGFESASRWPGKACLLEVATLQFFDFNVNVLPPTFH